MEEGNDQFQFLASSSDYDRRPWTFDFLSDLGRTTRKTVFPARNQRNRAEGNRWRRFIHDCLPPELCKSRGGGAREESHHRQKTRLLNEIPLTLFQSTSSPPWFPKKSPGEVSLGRMTGTTCFLLAQNFHHVADEPVHLFPPDSSIF